jgi:hypothetical protein
MSNTNTGGPAFPQSSVEQLASRFNVQGMTLRDYFAAKIMQAMLTRLTYDDRMPEAAYQRADAMLKAREQ